MKANLLSDRAVRHAKAGTHNDGNGLTLRVGANGKRSWVLRYIWQGKAANIGLGSYPAIGLREARTLADDRRVEVAEGRKPATARASAAPQSKPTFRDVAAQVIALRRPTWSSDRHAKQWIESLTNHAYPVIGDKLMEDITSGDVLAMLAAIWNELPETSTRVKQRTQIVFDYAVAAGLRADNPVTAVGKALPRRSRLKEHHKPVSYDGVPRAVVAIRQSTAHTFTKLALEFVILTAARAGEVRGMTWAEINFDCATWTVPAARMKMRKEHRVPLSERAIEILRLAQAQSRGEALVFPGSKGQLSNMAFTMLLRRLGLEAVTHGFRSSFKDWCLSETSAPWAVSEAALAHNLGNSMEAAYARTDLFEKRRELMDQWGRFVGSGNDD